MGTLNIRDGRSGNLEMACRRIKDLNMDIVMVTETEFSHGRHTSLSYGYGVYRTNCNNTNLGGVAIVVRKNDFWHIEDVKRGPNVIKCTLVHDDKRVVLIGAYIPLSEEDLSTMKELDTALIGVDVENVVIMGNLNVSYSNLKKIFAIFPIFCLTDEIIYNNLNYYLEWTS